MTVHLDALMAGEVADRVRDGIKIMASAVAKLTPVEAQSAHATLNIDHRDYVAYQDTKSAAHAGGLISFEEAQTTYQYLGSSAQDFNRNSLEVKLAITKVMATLMEQLYNL